MTRATTLAVLSLALAPAAAPAAIVITEVAPQTTAGTAAAINGDWWELTNTGPASVNLAGYRWADTEDRLDGPTPQANVFPSVTVGVNESVVILEETASSEAAWRANWAGVAGVATVQILGTDEMLPAGPGVTDTFSGLGNSNDGVIVYDPSGDPLDSFLYAANVRGTSFETARDGLDLGLSVAGQNGAAAGANLDVASPGVSATPEPATLATFAGLAVAAAARRRR